MATLTSTTRPTVSARWSSGPIGRPTSWSPSSRSAGTGSNSLFGAALKPILVPPWNRIAPHLVPMLPELRYAGLSTFGARPRARPVAGLTQANGHLDIIDWPGTRRFIGTETALATFIDHLAARRTGTVPDPAEPTGLLTHHLAHDDGAWAFVADLLEKTGGHKGASWLDADAVFAPTGPGR